MVQSSFRATTHGIGGFEFDKWPGFSLIRRMSAKFTDTWLLFRIIASAIKQHIFKASYAVQFQETLNY